MTATSSTQTLEHAASSFRSAYLLTVNERGGPHAVAVAPLIDGDRVQVTNLGRHSLTNAVQRPAVSLLFPAVVPGGYSLIVDAEATVAEETLMLVPTRIVLHRPEPAPGDVEEGACGSDCVPIGP